MSFTHFPSTTPSIFLSSFFNLDDIPSCHHHNIKTSYGEAKRQASAVQQPVG
jgi:hypothetical protein